MVAPSEQIEWKHFQEIDSTQTYVEQEHHHFDPNKMTVVSADFQPAGRGTGDRRWFMPPGCGVLMTMYFRIPDSVNAAVDSAPVRNTRRVLTLATLEVLREVTAAEAGLCGNLASAVASNPSCPDKLDGIIIGVGINVNNSPENLALIECALWPATSLLAESPSARTFEVAALRESLARRYWAKLQDFFHSGIGYFLPALTSSVYMLGKEVCFTDAETGKTVKGVLVAWTSHDQLVIRSGNQEHTFHSGHLRPPSATGLLLCSFEDSVLTKHFETIDSTQTYAETNYASFPTDKMTVISADFQTHGRGTLDRQWQAVAAQSALVTFFFQFPKTCSSDFVASHLPNVTQILAISAVDALCSVTAAHLGVSFGIKWPNDIICNGRKIGGILARAVEVDGHFDGVIIGIGVNINTEQADLDLIQRPVWPPTSLRAALGGAALFHVGDFRTRLARAFYENLGPFFAQGLGAFLGALKDRQVLRGQLVEFRVSEGTTIQAIFKGLNALGHILLEDHAGRVQAYVSGEVISATPTSQS